MIGMDRVQYCVGLLEEQDLPRDTTLLNEEMKGGDSLSGGEARTGR